MTEFSHWGLIDAKDEEGRYTVRAESAAVPVSQPGIVLTGSGEVLVHRSCNSTQAEGCTVAIIIGREQGALSREQITKMMRAWDLAVEVAEGRDEDVVLQPVPHEWQFSREDYLSSEEWQALRA